MKFRELLGHFVDIDENDKANKAILEKHITHYMLGVSQVLGVMCFLTMVFEIVIAFLIHSGRFSFLLLTPNGTKVTFLLYLKFAIIYEVILSLSFSLYFFFWRKGNFTVKKVLMCIITILFITLFCFYHWKNTTLSILYIVPVIIAIPLDKKRNKLVMFSCIGFIILYSIFQYSIHKDEAALLTSFSSIITIIALEFICMKIHNSMNRSFLDIRSYAYRQKALYDQISHDELTGSFSKNKLDSDLKNLQLYTSLSFIDVDKFKNINDTYGHQMGDNILKLLVFCFNINKLNIYRNGGDEFIILSSYTASDLSEKLERIKSKFTFYADEFFSVKATVSIGIININKSLSGSENIRHCDALMYKSKERGRDTLTVEN